MARWNSDLTAAVLDRVWWPGQKGAFPTAELEGTSRRAGLDGISYHAEFLDPGTAFGAPHPCDVLGVSGFGRSFLRSLYAGAGSILPSD